MKMIWTEDLRKKQMRKISRMARHTKRKIYVFDTTEEAEKFRDSLAKYLAREFKEFNSTVVLSAGPDGFNYVTVVAPKYAWKCTWDHVGIKLHVKHLLDV